MSHVSRDDETGEIAKPDATGEVPAPDELGAEPPPGGPVGRVNLPVEPEDDELVDEVEMPAGAEPIAELVPAAPVAVAAVASDSMMQKVLFGVLAVLIMALALFIMLQGVFEQKMPV
jgi:hypothetical protein